MGCSPIAIHDVDHDVPVTARHKGNLLALRRPDRVITQVWIIGEGPQFGAIYVDKGNDRVAILLQRKGNLVAIR